jgi:hypothetical protein
MSIEFWHGNQLIIYHLSDRDGDNIKVVVTKLNCSNFGWFKRIEELCASELVVFSRNCRWNVWCFVVWSGVEACVHNAYGANL